MKILIVEDDADARGLVRETLERDGTFSVRECEPGETVKDAVRRLRPDLLLLDATMPDLDGLCVARALRADPETSGVAIVFMTACLRPEDIARYAEVGALDVIARPFDAATLPGRLRAARAAGARGPAAALRSLEQAYRAELPGRIRDIERTLDGEPSGTGAVVHEAALLAHRLAGSAALFGMDEVSRSARALEDALARAFLDDAEASRRSIEGLVTELRRRADAAATMTA